MKIRTGYSFRHAVGHLPDVISRLKEIGWTVAPIADRASTFGFNKFTKLAKKAEMRVAYGVELGVVARIGDARPVIDHWTFFAKDSLRPLHDLVGLATSNSDKEPLLTYAQALDAQGLIKITGPRVQLSAIKRPHGNLFVALAPSTPKMVITEALQRKFKLIATGDNVYPREEDLEFYRVALGNRASTQTYPQHILSDDEWKEATKWLADKATQNIAIKNREAALASCQATMKKASLLVPEKPKTLRAMCIEGAKRTGVNLKDPIYKARLDRELGLIEEKKFEDYFYVIADMVNWAKKRMVVGPARGSSCGSLVCYLLNITTIDPIPYGLIFERFIDTTRTDLPDIDIDFSDKRRDMVFAYAEEKYGSERVARLGTVGLFKPRSALNQAGTSLQIPKWMVEKVLDGVIERSGGDSRALQALEDTLNDTEMGRKMLSEYPEVKIAGRMEGHPNNASQHAAGIVITQEPVAEYVAVDRRSKSAMVDKKDAEDLNLLKIDALGLTQLSVFERTLQLIGQKDVSGYLETIPLDDKKAFDVLNKGHFAGIFQFTGMALQSLTRQTKIQTLDDMVSITALARPGPLATGGANSWIKRRNGTERISSLHPLLSELTKETHGVVVYQETVMNIVRQLGRMSWEDTSAVRKAMSGRLGDEFFEGFWKKFLKGALENKIDEATAKEIWNQVCTFGSWAFNKAHAVAYGIMSYYCCWLKAHHPLEFAAATLDAESDPAKQILTLRELSGEGIDYLPVDPDHSTDRWTPVKKGKKQLLVGPLTSIKGIGPAAVSEILDARKRGAPIRETLRKRLANAKTDIDSIYPIRDAVKRLHPDLGAIGIVSTPRKIIDVQCGIQGEVMVLAVVKRIAPKDENEPSSVLKRGGKVYTGPTAALNMFVNDDSDEIFAKVDRFKFERLGRPIVERGRAGKALYAIKGTVPPGFRMISINNVKFLGFLDD